MPSRKNNLSSSGSPAPKKSTPKVSVVQSPNPSGASLGRVTSYDDFVRGRRLNHSVDGFWFDQDTFENLIDDWADFDDILTILQVDEKQLNSFCRALYGESAKNAYNRLRAISKVIARKALDKLAKNGNASAVSIAKTHFAQLFDDDASKPINITIKNDLD